MSSRRGEPARDGRRAGTIPAATVRRASGPWSPAVHALLDHLDAAGFDGAPRVRTTGTPCREVVQRVEGEEAGDQPPYPSWVWADDTLAQVGRLLRRYHGVVAGFRPVEPLRWAAAEASVGPAEVVCHNDVAPRTLVRRRGRVVALLDWDLACPAPPEWDLAHAAWQLVPLHPPGLAARLGYAPAREGAVAARARRLRLLADEYGLARREGFVELVRARVEVARAGLRDREASDAYVRPLPGGSLEDHQRTLAYLDDTGDVLDAALHGR